jgi:hypothetical protein
MKILLLSRSISHVNDQLSLVCCLVVHIFSLTVSHSFHLLLQHQQEEEYEEFQEYEEEVGGI